MAIKIITKIDNKEYVYKDIKLDLETIDKHKNRDAKSGFYEGYDINTSNDLNAIKNSLMNLLSIRPGELHLEPSFGLPLYKYIGEPNTKDTATLIGNEIVDAVTRWEPRVIIDKIYVLPYPDEYLFKIMMEITIPNIKEKFRLGGTLLENTMQMTLVSDK